MKLTKRRIITFLLLATLFIVSGCKTNDIISNTELKFAFQTDTPMDSAQKKNVTISKALDELKLDCTLKADSGAVEVEVVRLSDNEIAWKGRYEEDASFAIVLPKVEANSEYQIKVNTQQTKKVSLVITSTESLVAEKPTPDKPSK